MSLLASPPPPSPHPCLSLPRSSDRSAYATPYAPTPLRPFVSCGCPWRCLWQTAPFPSGAAAPSPTHPPPGTAKAAAQTLVEPTSRAQEMRARRGRLRATAQNSAQHNAVVSHGQALRYAAPVAGAAPSTHSHGPVLTIHSPHRHGVERQPRTPGQIATGKFRAAMRRRAGCATSPGLCRQHMCAKGAVSPPSRPAAPPPPQPAAPSP